MDKTKLTKRIAIFLACVSLSVFPFSGCTTDNDDTESDNNNQIVSPGDNTETKPGDNNDNKPVFKTEENQGNKKEDKTERIQ